jgi:hypothetical protein
MYEVTLNEVQPEKQQFVAQKGAEERASQLTSHYS